MAPVEGRPGDRPGLRYDREVQAAVQTDPRQRVGGRVAHGLGQLAGVCRELVVRAGRGRYDDEPGVRVVVRGGRQMGAAHDRVAGRDCLTADGRVTDGE
ncbi:hypothetical protein [Streptomyces sp. CPS1]